MNKHRNTGLLPVVALLVAISGCAPRLPSWTPIYRRPASYGSVHVVRKGETLSSIARRYGVSSYAIARYNGLRDPNRIEVGQRLRIPRQDAIARLYRLPKKRYSTKPAPTVVTPSKPFLWPLRGPITRYFSDDANGPHKGIDIQSPDGTHIRSAKGGRVLFSGVGPEGYGLIVIVEHESSYVTVYAHNKANLVKAGQSVARGQYIAYVGRSGNATGPHLHFEVRLGADPRDPLTVLPSRKRQ
jgi:murein DD-endopeptidase MepM/ murein hydrolase activator NlpD